MKNVLSLLTLCLLITSCASLSNSHSVLHQKFSQYEMVANKNNIIDVATEFFTPSLLGENYQVNQSAVGQLLFKNYMLNPDSHFEKIAGNEGCLTINGYDEDSSPLIFSLKYVLSDNRWLIDKIHVVFVNNKSEFSARAKCPSEYPVK